MGTFLMILIAMAVLPYAFVGLIAFIALIIGVSNRDDY